MIDQYIEMLEEKQIELTMAQRAYDLLKKQRRERVRNGKNLEKARVLIQKASKITQQKLSIKISEIVSSALKAVFEDSYDFVVDFVERRNVTECDLLLAKGDTFRKPLDSCGYGVADIVSLALRVAYWKLDGEARNVLILDEPTRNLSKEYQPLASLMLKKLSESGIQFIIVTHNTELSDAADRVFRVEKPEFSNVRRLR